MSEINNATETGDKLTIQRTGMARLLSRWLWSASAGVPTLTAEALTLTGGTRPTRIPLSTIRGTRLVRGAFWWQVRIRTTKGTQNVSWLTQEESKRLFGVLRKVCRSKKALTAASKAIRSVYDDVNRIAEPSHYLRKRTFSEWLKEIARRARRLPRNWPKLVSSLPEAQMVTRIRAVLEDSAGFRKAANKRYVANETQRCASILVTHDGHPLTEEQQKAVVVDEARNLVVAAAGSGKTALLVAKVLWLVHRRGLDPSRLLLLAYSKAACNELRSRIRERLGDLADKIEIRTFHGFGMKVIRKSREAMRVNEPVRLSKSATNAKAFVEQLNRIVADLVRSDPSFADRLRRWSRSHFAPYRSLHRCENLGQYWEHLRRHHVVTLRGERAMSFEECEVANFCWMNNIPYRYRPAYEPEIHTPARKKYRPSFYLPDADLYIEVVALSRAGEAPRCVQGWEGSLQSIQYKRQIHAKHGTTLIEVFSHERLTGKLIPNLERNLVSQGVHLTPITDRKLLSELDDQGRLKPFIGLVGTFLRHFKGSSLTYRALTKRVAKADDRERAELFMAMFQSVKCYYDKALQASGEIDYDDMISAATRLIGDKQADVSFDYVLVDEFQDISRARANLLLALLARTDGSQLFAVGDDWQSIYRFAGSDVSIMREFEDVFGDTERLFLRLSFRCAEPIARAATRFVLENPQQIKKKVRSRLPATGPGVQIGFPGFDDRASRSDFAIYGNDNGDRRGHDRHLLRKTLGLIEADADGNGATSDVLLLGRYKHTVPNSEALRELARDFPKLCFSRKTIHGAKGLEADYVVVFGLCTGRYSFPSEIVDDPLLELVLGGGEDASNAEERRVMYVAMTRAKRQVFLLVDSGPPSAFVHELMGQDYDREVEAFGQRPERDLGCPVCKEGRLQRRKRSADGVPFLGCSNWSYCSYTKSLGDGANRRRATRAKR